MSFDSESQQGPVLWTTSPQYDMSLFNPRLFWRDCPCHKFIISSQIPLALVVRHQIRVVFNPVWSQRAQWSRTRSKWHNDGGYWLCAWSGCARCPLYGSSRWSNASLGTCPHGPFPRWSGTSHRSHRWSEYYEVWRAAPPQPSPAGTEHEKLSNREKLQPVSGEKTIWPQMKFN